MNDNDFEDSQENRRRRNAISAGAGYDPERDTIDSFRTRPGSDERLEIRTIPAERPVQAQTKTTTFTTPTRMEDRTEINWGHVAQGALMVGAVVVVGVVAIGAAGALLSTPLIGGIVESTALAVGPLVHTLTVAAGTAVGVIPHLIGATFGYLGSLLGISVGAGAASSGTVLAGQALVGGGAVAAATGIAATHFSGLDFFTHHQVMTGGETYTDTQTVHTPDTAGATSTTFASKFANSTHASGMEEFAHHAEHMTHHAGEESHHDHMSRHSRTVDSAAQAAMNRSSEASRSWADEHNDGKQQHQRFVQEMMQRDHQNWVDREMQRDLQRGRSGNEDTNWVDRASANSDIPRNDTYTDRISARKSSYAQDLEEKANDLQHSLDMGR